MGHDPIEGDEWATYPALTTFIGGQRGIAYRP